MRGVLNVGLVAEGSTDYRFYRFLIPRILEQTAVDCKGIIDIYLRQIKHPSNKLDFPEMVRLASQVGFLENGISILIVHTDADSSSDSVALKNKIAPAKKHLTPYPESEYCKLMVPLVPVYMTESWMLADPTLLKSEIELGKGVAGIKFPKKPESVSNPKDLINKAIQSSQAHLSRRKKRYYPGIGSLYEELGQNLSLEKLDRLPSYQKFKESLREAFQELNLM